MNEYINTISEYFIRNRQRIHNTFTVIYWLFVPFLFIAVFASRINDSVLLFIFSIGSLLGKIALILFIASLLPGIGERFGIQNKPLALLKIFRREIGILMYITAIAHLILAKLVITTSLTELLMPMPFEIMGTLSLFILFFLFITSNTFSQVKLRLNWYRIQRLIYIGMFFIFLHVAFLKLSIWTVLMGILIIVQAASFIALYKRTKSFTGGKPF